MDLKKMDVDYEHQPFDESPVNPYEIVIALSKKAREVNAKAHKYLGPETEVKAVNMAINKMKNDVVSFEYDQNSVSLEPALPESGRKTARAPRRAVKETGGDGDE